jgi:hypothetical protein
MQKVIAADANLPANPTPPARGPDFHKSTHPSSTKESTEREREREREQGVVDKAYLATKGVSEQRHG